MLLESWDDAALVDALHPDELAVRHRMLRRFLHPVSKAHKRQLRLIGSLRDILQSVVPIEPILSQYPSARPRSSFLQVSLKSLNRSRLLLSRIVMRRSSKFRSGSAYASRTSFKTRSAALMTALEEISRIRWIAE